MLFGVALVICPQLIGGAPPWAVVLCAALTAAALVTALRETRHQSPGTSVIVPLMLVALVWTALQALPLPCGLVEWIAPESVHHYRRALALLGKPAPQLCALTRDPGATHAEIVKGCAIICAYVCACLLARTGQRNIVLAAVALACGATALTSLAHIVVGAERVFGLYAPEAKPLRELFAPIINPNSLGGLIAMGIPLLLTLWQRTVASTWRPVWLVSALLSILAVLLTRSRGAIAVMVVGLVAGLGVNWARRARGRRRAGDRGAVMVSMAGVALALGLGVYSTFDALEKEVREGDLSKLELVRAGAELALRHPLVGVGRGAFSAAFVAHAGTTARFEYAENFVVQWASEWGLPIALMLLAALVRAAWRTVRGTTDPIQVGGLIGLGCMVLQNQVDLGLELVGITVVTGALAAATIDGHAPSSGWAGGDVRRAAMVALLLTVLSGLGLGFTLVENDLRSELTELSRLREAGDRVGFAETLSEAIVLHPSEPNLTHAASKEATDARDPKAGRWINRTMELAPHWGEPHALAAAWLWYMNRHDQAVIELREAAARDIGHGRALACRIAQVAPDKALQATPSGPMRAGFLEHVAQCAPSDSAAALEADRTLVRENPDQPKPRLRLIKRLIKQGKIDDAVRESRALAAQHPEDTQAQLGLVNALRATKRFDEAISACNDAIARVDDPYAILLQRMQLESDSKRLEDMHHSAEELRRVSAGNPERLAGALMALARHETEAGNLVSALRAAQEAQRIQPDVEKLRMVARLLRSLGDRAGLFLTLSEICAMNPGGPACRERDALRTPGLAR